MGSPGRDQASSFNSPEEYIERHFRLASDRVMGRMIGWNRNEVARYLDSRGLKRTEGEEKAIRSHRGVVPNLPEFRRPSHWLMPVPLVKRMFLEALLASVLAFAAYLVSTPAAVGSAADARGILEVSRARGLDLFQGVWTIPAKAVLLVPAADPALRIHIFTAALAALGVGMAVLVLRKSSFSAPASLGAALAMAFAAPVWSSATVAGATCLTPALFLLAALFLLRKREAPGWNTRVPLIALLALFLLHLIFLFPGGGSGIQDRAALLPRRLFLDPSVPVGLAAGAGAFLFRRRIRGDFRLWIFLLVLALISTEGTLIAALLILPTAFLIEKALALLARAPRSSGWILPALAGAVPFGIHLGAHASWNDFTVQDYGEGVLASVPGDARLFAPSPHQYHLLAYLREVRGEGRGLELADALPPRGQLRLKAPTFVGPRGRNAVSAEFETAASGPFFRLAYRGRMPPAGGDPWERFTMRNFDATDPGALIRASTEGNRVYLYDLALARAFSDPGRAGDWIESARRLAGEAGELQRLGDVALELKMGKDLAGELYESARSMDPAYAAPRRALARMAFAARDDSGARALVEEIQEYTPGEFPEAFLLGEIAEAREDWTEAIARFREARTLNPHDYRPSRHLGLIFHKRGDRELALVYLEESLSIFPYQEDLRLIVDPTGKRLGRTNDPQVLRPGEAPRPPSPWDHLPPGIRPPGAGRPGSGLPGLPGTSPRPSIPGLPGLPSPGIPGTRPNFPNPQTPFRNR